jgi:hypothetical protein
MNAEAQPGALREQWKTKDVGSPPLRSCKWRIRPGGGSEFRFYQNLRDFRVYKSRNFLSEIRRTASLAYLTIRGFHLFGLGVGS